MLIMAHGLNSVVLKRNPNTLGIKTEGKAGGIGSRRIFAPQFKLQVLDSYRNDADCKGNQRATARKYGIHRRQIQKWLQVETNLRNSVMKIKSSGLIVNNHVQNPEPVRKCGPEMALGVHRQRDDTSPVAYSQCSGGATQAGEQQSTPAPIEHRLHLQCCGEQRVPYIPRQASPAAYSEHERQQQRQTTPPRLTAPSSSAVCTSPEAHRVPCASDTAIITARSSPPASSSPLVAHQQHQHPTVRVVPTLVAAAAVVNDPCVSTLILDYSTHRRHTIRPDTNNRDESMPPPFSTNDSNNAIACAASEIVASSSSPSSSSPPLLYPIDLSLKKHQSTVDLGDLRAPVNLPLCCSSYANSPSYHDSEQYDDACCSSPNDELFAEAWDLSVKNSFKRKYSEIDCYENDNHNVTSSVDVKPVLTPEPVKKPIKLFKPYLDDDDYSSSASSMDSRQNLLKTPKEEYFSCSRSENFKPSGVYISDENYKTKVEYTQFENVKTKEEYYTAEHLKTEEYYSPDCGHIIVTENDCYNNNNNNNNNNNTVLKNSFDVGYCNNYNANPRHVFYTSPINFITRNYEFELNNSNFKNEDAIKNNQSVKQRQSYSLDFKLSAIDCYYSDAVCRGNQRAVANKYKIHRRQVQKWLKQENELRERIETSKQIHAVS